MDDVLPAHETLLEALKKHGAQHNQSVAAAIFFNTLLAALLWAALYFVSQWLLILFLTIIREGNGALPSAYPLGFLAVAFALLAAAWLDHLATPCERVRDNQDAFKIVMDFLLAIPRLTFAAWGHFRAFVRLKDHEWLAAANLVADVARQRRLSLQHLTVELPDDRQRDRIILAMSILRILELRQESEGPALRLSALRPPEIQRFTPNLPPIRS